jgi:hypothetical protein
MRRRHPQVEREPGAPEEPRPAPARPPVATGGNQMMVRLLSSGTENAAPQQDIAERITGRLGRGQSLPSGVRSDMESGLGHSFGDVVVHRDAESATLADQLGARAFTTGRDIFFGQGAYAPGTPAGRETLAHELTHTVQQQSGPVAGTRVAGNLVVSDPGDREEREAASVASAMRGGGPVAIEEHATSHIHRDPATDSRVTTLESQTQALTARVDSLALDNRWRSKFGALMKSYERVIWEITAAFEAATSGFAGAQQKQAQIEAVKAQFWGAVLTVGFAAGFEFVFAAGLGSLGSRLALTEAQIKTVIEKVENPANAAASGTSNVAATAAANSAVNDRPAQPLPPAAGGGSGGGTASPMAFLATNQAELAKHGQAIEEAFSARAAQTVPADLAAQERIYQGLYDDLQKAGKGVENLKSPPELAKVIETHMWAIWIKNQDLAAQAAVQAGVESGSGSLEPFGHHDAQYDLGSYVEDRFNELGIARAASVTLTGHWYSPNSPSDWKQKLFNYAEGYGETLAKK